jgi:hypothetical protein
MTSVIVGDHAGKGDNEKGHTLRSACPLRFIDTALIQSLLVYNVINLGWGDVFAVGLIINGE